MVTDGHVLDIIRLLYVARDTSIMHPEFYMQRIMASNRTAFVKASSFYINKEMYSSAFQNILDYENGTNISYIGNSSFELTTYLQTTPSGPPIAIYCTRAAAVDTGTRKPTSIPPELKPADFVNIAQPLQVIRPSQPENYFQTLHTVQNIHIDFNSNVSMRVYIFLSFDCLEEAFNKGYFTARDDWMMLSNMQLEKVEILFKSEAVLHDNLTVNIWKEVIDGRTHLFVHVLISTRTVVYLSMTFYNDRVNMVNASL